MKNHRSTQSSRPKPVAGQSMKQGESVWCHHRISWLFQFVHHTVSPFALTLFPADFKIFFVVRRSRPQHRVNQPRQFAGQSNRCAFRSLPLFNPPVPTREVQGSLSGDDPSHLAKHTLQIRIAFVNVSTGSPRFFGVSPSFSGVFSDFTNFSGRAPHFLGVVPELLLLPVFTGFF